MFGFNEFVTGNSAPGRQVGGRTRTPRRHPESVSSADRVDLAFETRYQTAAAGVTGIPDVFCHVQSPCIETMKISLGSVTAAHQGKICSNSLQNL